MERRKLTTKNTQNAKNYLGPFNFVTFVLVVVK